MSIGEYCNREVVVADSAMDAQEAAQLMRTYHVGDLVIVEERGDGPVPVGIVTDRDLVLETLAQQIDPTSITVGDIMSPDPQCVRDSEDLLEALRIMADTGVRRLLVLNSDGGLEGILTLDDAIELLAEQVSCMVRIVGREQRIEKIERH